MSPTAPFLAPERDSAFKKGRPKGGGTTFFYLPGAVIQSGTGTWTTGDVDCYTPFYADTPLVVSEMQCNVTTLEAAKNLRMGIYVADTDWQPMGAPLVDSGDISIGTTGIKNYTLGTPLVLPRGRYLTVFNFNSTGTGVVTYARVFFPSMGQNTNFVNVINLYVGRSYAAFPTPGTAWTAVNTNESGIRGFVFLKISQP